MYVGYDNIIGRAFLFLSKKPCSCPVSTKPNDKVLCLFTKSNYFGVFLLLCPLCFKIILRLVHRSYQGKKRVSIAKLFYILLHFYIFPYLYTSIFPFSCVAVSVTRLTPTSCGQPRYRLYVHEVLTQYM